MLHSLLNVYNEVLIFYLYRHNSLEMNYLKRNRFWIEPMTREGFCGKDVLMLRCGDSHNG